MKYAVYDVITPTEPIAIYDTEAEANKKAEIYNSYLLEKVYTVKPYTEGITVMLTQEEVKAIMGLCRVAITHLEKFGETEQASVISSIQNKIQNKGE